MSRFYDFYNDLSCDEQWSSFPGRIFLDSDVVQFLSDFGEFIYEGAREDSATFRGPKGVLIKEGSRLHGEIGAIAAIFRNIGRASFEFAISQNTVREKILSDPQRRLDWWVTALQDHWNAVTRSYVDPFSLESQQRHERSLKDTRLAANLSLQDRNIVLDAIRFDCQALLTVDKFADRNLQKHCYEKYKLMVMWPSDFIKILSPFQALYNG